VGAIDDADIGIVPWLRSSLPAEQPAHTGKKHKKQEDLFQWDRRIHRNGRTVIFGQKKADSLDY
jgi:hypothetical protein